MNQFSGIGRLVRPVELNETSQGTSVVNNVLAIPKRRAVNEQTADFIPFVAWGKTAELLKQYVKKRTPNRCYWAFPIASLYQ